MHPTFSKVVVSTSYVQQQMNFIATLTGKDMVPPVNTPAAGVARFHMNPDGGLCYSVDVYHITGVLGAHIGTKNGTELADLTNPRSAIMSIESNIASACSSSNR